MQKIYQKSLNPGIRHPCRNDQGNSVTISQPTLPLPMSAFGDSMQLALMLPGVPAPAALNGAAFQPWQTAPATLAGWAQVAGQASLDEPPMTSKNGKKAAAGVVITEADGRIWLVAPTNGFGGYQATFPKGRLEPGLSLQATAIKEAFEESGLQVEITGLIGDFERSLTLTRYYTARRVGGLPTDMGWESQAVLLAPKSQLLKILNHANDHAVIQALAALNNEAQTI
jgi:ADP-ribose pyrophosphatase YjhB (NUDIX family)